VHPTVFHYLFLAGAALLGGAINSVAGGGSFITFPALLQFGLLPIQANATSSVALWPGQVASIAGYREDLKKNLRMVLPVMAVAAIGGLAGSLTLLHGSQRSFLRLVPYLFLLGSVSFGLSGPIRRRMLRRMLESTDHPERRRHVAMLPLLGTLLAVTYYIGYFGAGAGLLTMSALSLCGVERIAEVNALKTVITTTANAVACTTFILGGAVEWRYCWMMMIACAVGGYTGARNARPIGDRILRPVIVTLGIGLAVWFFLHKGAL
jgi:uncharacterized membrane protein YfcA